MIIKKKPHITKQQMFEFKLKIAGLIPIVCFRNQHEVTNVRPNFLKRVLKGIRKYHTKEECLVICDDTRTKKMIDNLWI